LKEYLLTGAALAAAIAGGVATARTLPANTGHGAAPVAGKLVGYLTAGALDGELVIGPPPAPESPRGQADRAIYLETRSQEGTARWKKAVQDNDLWNGGAMTRMSCALGAEVGPKAAPRTWRLLQRVEIDARTVGTPAKDHFNRTRPPIGDDRPICVKREDWLKTNASYPSGHAMTGWAWGLILSELAPRKAGALMEAGAAIGDSRVICGVHYPSDVEAGRKLGSAMVARLHADPAFQKDLAAARAELPRDHMAPKDCGA
jgi:acid phosphatase (class A)